MEQSTCRACGNNSYQQGYGCHTCDLDVENHAASTPDSPFDSSGVQFAWDSTSLAALKKCPRYYQYMMLDNWQPKRTSQHLTFGIHYHRALEEYQLMKAEAALMGVEVSHDTLVRAVLRNLLVASVGFDSDDPKKNRWTLARSVVWHLDHYRDDPTETVILANGKPATELSFRFDIGNGLLFSGHLDRIVRFGESTFVMDHKTSGSAIGSHYFKRYNPDTQMTGYTLASQVAFAQPVKGVIIDAAYIAVGFTEFARDITHRSEAHLDEFVAGVHSWRGMAERYTAARFWPLNETSCDKYGGCMFREVCARSPQVRDKFLATDFTQGKPWNPLEAR